MGLLHFLRRTLASFLRPWILQKDILEPLMLHIHLSQIVLELQFLELDCELINTSLLSTSPLLLRHARLDRAKLTISFFRSPGISLVFQGLHFVCHIRPPDDSFWGDREKQLVDIRKKEAIAALDSLGASVHLAAERRAKEAATSSMFKVFIANLVLQALQVELHDASAELYSNAPDFGKSLYSLTLTSLALEEGYGLAGAFVRRLADISKKADYSLIKLCFVENLGLRLSMLKESSGHLKPADLSNGLDGMKSHENSVQYCVLLWKSVLLITGFQNGKLNGIDASFAETVIQFSPAEAEAILSTIKQLQGASRALHTTLSEETQRLPKGARYLWQRAFEKVTDGSWRKLRGAVEVGLLRQRYSQLYASWLLKAGEGICNGTGLLSVRKGSKRKKDVLISLERDLYRLEQELPIEAIVLARFFGRNKALIDSKKLVMTAQPLGSVLWSRAILCVFAFWRTIQTLYGTLVRMLKSIFNVLNNFVKQLPFVSGIQWILLRCAKDISSLCCRRFDVSNVPTGLDIRHPHLPAAFLEGLNNNRLLRSKNMRGRTYFKGTFHMGSVTFIGSMECFTRNYGSKLFTRSGMNILGGNNLPGVRFAFGNLSVAHSSQARVLSFELVCGYLKGQVVTVPFGRSVRDTDKKTQGGILHIEKDGTEFLQSGPAPQTQLPENVKNHLGSCEKAVSHFLNFLGKEMVLVSKDLEEASEINVCPFIVCVYENTQTSYPLPGGNMDSMMCSLAVGCITCKLDLEIYGLLGMLMVQLLDIANANRQPINSDEVFNSTSAASTSIAAGSDWEVLYADQIRQFVSTVVLKQELWLSLTLAAPKIEFSGSFLRSPSASKTKDGGVSYDPAFLMDLGLLKVTVWPAMAEQINRDDTLEQPFLGARNRKAWLMKLPSPNIQGNEVVQGSYEHEEIGNNGIVSLHGTTISLRALCGSEKNELVGPLNLLWRFSLCRDHLISPFGVCIILSAAVMGSCSPIQVEILFEELELLLEALKILSTTTQEFSLMRVHLEAVRCERELERGHRDEKFIGQGNSISLPQLLYYAVSLEVKIEEFGATLSEQRILHGEHIRRGVAEQKKLLPWLNMHKRMDQISMRNMWLNFSWGDGCMLLFSITLDESSLLIVKNQPEGSKDSPNIGIISDTWKGKNMIAKANVDNEHEAGKCELFLQQILFRISKPWCLSDVEALTPTVPEKDEDLVCEKRKYCMSIEFEMEKLHMNDGESNNLVKKALSRLDDATCLTIDIAISNDYKRISVISKGGLFFLHTQALLMLSQELRRILSSKKVSRETESGELVLVVPYSNIRSKDEGLVLPPNLGRSVSLPLQQPQERQFHRERLYSAPFESSIIDIHDAAPAGSENIRWLPEDFHVEISGLCFVLAQNRVTSSGKEQGALLLEVGGNFKLQTNVMRQTLMLETTGIRLSIFSEGKDSGGMTGQLSRIPRFGSSFALHTGVSGGINIKENTLLTDDGEMTTNTGHLVSKDSEKNLSKGLITKRENDYILENLSISLKLENHFGYLRDSNGWSGSCVLLGLDIGITIWEVQLLLALISSISSVPQPFVKDESNELKDSGVTPSKPISDKAFQIPDGSIVAVKDVQEHLYMAVEKANNNSYRLIGVLHYSLVGDRGFFKVKYQKNSRDNSHMWFSLLSVGARNADGEPFRIHYRPGSGLADISSTHDGSWELWQAHPYKYSSKAVNGDIDLYSDLNRNLVHLLNQKSKQGLTLATGAPVMVKKPGSPFKFKVLQSGMRIQPFLSRETQNLSTNTYESKNYPSSLAAAIPQVDLKVGRIIFTLLHESGGGKYLIPLLRGSIEDTEAVMHIQSLKIRFIGGCKFLFEYFEGYVNQWSMIIQPMEIGLFYRMRIGGERNVDRVKLPMSFFARCKRVDITISEKSLDIILFVIGILKLAGPYSIKYSPVLATSCLVQNNTGLDLRCSFDNHEGKEFVKIPAWRTDTFFVRNLISRRDSWPAKTLSSVSFNLEKGGVGLTSPVLASLLEPSLTAIRTRLERVDGHKKTTGSIIVVEVSKQSQDGVVVTVSPMTRIHNCTGLSIELRCRRPNSDFEGASVFLKDGDIVDDSMGTFDALSLKGELKKALSSFGLGDYLLSVRPVGSVPAFSVESPNDAVEGNKFDWSEDIKGAKPIHISGFFEKLQYGFKKSLIGQNASHSFGTVFCALNFKKDAHGNAFEISKGMHILIRFTSRYVPLVSLNSNDKSDASRPIVAWQEQKELVFLPTLCIHNYLDMQISFSSKAGAGKPTFDYHTSIESSCKVSLFADLTELVFAISLDELSLASKDISMREWSRSVGRSTAGSDSMKEMELDLDFGDNCCARLKLFRANDGVLQVVVYSQYAVKNSSDIALLFCMPKQSGFFWKMLDTGGKKVQWPSGEVGNVLNSGGRMSLLKRSSHLLLRMAERLSETSSLDLDSLSGSTELSLKIFHEDGLIEETQLGVRMEVTATGSTDPTHTINIGSRYVVFNDSQEAILICQDGLQDDETAAIFLETGEHVSLKTQFYPGPKQRGFGYSQLAGSDTAKSTVFFIRFRFQQNDWDWTGPVCASSLGSFSLRVHKRLANLSIGDTVETGDETIFKFISIVVEDRSPSLVIRFQTQSADAAPYRIENLLPQASIFFYQKGLSEVVTTLEPRKIVSYAWDNLSQPHKLVVGIHGTQLNNEIKLDKLGPWKLFRAFRQKKLFDLHLPFVNQPDFNVPADIVNGDLPLSLDSMKVGYEIGADGFQRVLWVCEDVFSSKLTKWQSHISFPSARMDFRVPVFGITIVENLKHQKDTGAGRETSDGMYRMSPIISMRLSNFFCEVLNTQKYFLFQLKVETLSVDERWEGAPFSAMLRVHSEDRFKKGETVLHMAAIVSNQASNPIHVKYSSILLQTIDVNLDEETLMKLVPFYRYSLAESTSSRQLYFERFEIHPIKIIASFIPGQPLADYTSMQETFRTLLHSFIKVPSIRGSTVELNGVLLTHALMTFRQLAIKCAQHYSWYALRAVYLVKGSKLLPPAFTSLFDDSAASSLDVFFDPSNGSIDLQGLTLGMFNFLTDGLKNRGLSGTSRYIGDLERTMKTAGSNILFAVLTEVSDNVLKGAETGGLDGMVNGFRRGILNVSMEPSLLRTAVVKGGSSRRIKLDNSAGTDETYVEGYLQAMLDTLYQQHYLKVKVVDDQVLLKNLPPNSALVDEIMGTVKSFLVREGLLAGETSAAPLQSWRRLQGENDKRIVPAVAALCEQLFVIFAVRALRNQARSWLNSSGIASSTWNRFFKKEGDGKGQPDTEDRQEKSRGMKGILFSFVISSAMAYIDGRLCRHIPNTLARRVVSGFLLSFVE